MVRWGELQSIPPRPKLWGDADIPEDDKSVRDKFSRHLGNVLISEVTCRLCLQDRSKMGTPALQRIS
ncbi:Calcium-Activated Chloride Channel Regulator 4 [Manis pentadactyla]|nr:Calcium-Activated Chloride Channel Regulator 4 [Manis pentadactyla]